MSFWNEKEVRQFKELSFYNALIAKPYIKRLNNIDMLCELPLYDELTIVKTTKNIERVWKKL